MPPRPPKDQKPPPKMGRPRLDPDGGARVIRSFRLHPDTAAAIEAEAERAGISQAQVVDRLAQRLTKTPRV